MLFRGGRTTAKREDSVCD